MLLLTLAQWQQALPNNPFADEAVERPQTVHYFFLAKRPDAPDIAQLRVIAGKTERFELIDRVFYLHAPDDLGRSKLAGNMDRMLGVATTARNDRTVRKIDELLAA